MSAPLSSSKRVYIWAGPSTYPDASVFCLDGVDIADPSVEEVGRNLFSNPLYVPYAELRTFGRRMEDFEAGVGYYPFRNPTEQKGHYRIAAWRTVRPGPASVWKVVAKAQYVPFDAKDLAASSPAK